MKDKILNALKQEYAHLGLGDGILSGLAEMLAGTKLVTDENLQGIVAGQKAYLEDLQKSNDKRVQDEDPERGQHQGRVCQDGTRRRHRQGSEGA